MVRKIIEFSAHNRLLVLLLTLAVVAFGFVTLRKIPLDAIPDLSDTQVIVYSQWDRSPDIIEDQVTYPIVTALLGSPGVKAIRGYSDFGYSFVYVIFEDGTDIYFARSRVLEYLARIQGSLPTGVKTELGPDATGVGWVFQYALVDQSGKHDLSELRSYQDWYLRYALQSVPGVAEVAGIGGFEKQYQVTVDPEKLRQLGIPLMSVVDAIRRSNGETGGGLIEWRGAEYMVRGRGYLTSPQDLRSVVVKSNRETPVLLGDVAQVGVGPRMRRGAADLDGLGDTVGGIVVMRHGENALSTIRAVKQKLQDLEGSLPEGVKVVSTYDRSELILAAIHNLEHELVAEIGIVCLVILIFLWHVPSAIVPILTIPVSVFLAFIPMYFLGVSSNIMSLSGLAISIGVLVDGAIVEVENAYKKLERWREEGSVGDVHAIRLAALLEVAPSVFFSLLVIAASFLPVFTLVDQEGRLFRPLAYTKTLAIAVASVLALTLDPAVRLLFTRMEPFRIGNRVLSWLVNGALVGRYYPEDQHPISRLLFRLYEGPCRFVLRHPKAVIASAILLMATTVPVYLRLGSEFMPPLNEGVILYMPTTLPGISITQAEELLRAQDRILKSFPEVVSVFGKAGRAATSTDPAPLSMMETTVVLEPHEEWREKPRWYSSWAPEPLKAVLRHVWSDRLSWEELIDQMDAAIRIPGNTNAWTMPIKGRIDMLSTGVRTPVGVKVFGSDLVQIQKLGEQVAAALSSVPGTRSVYAERAAGGNFVDFTPRREVLARYGLTIADVQDVIATAVGGEIITTTVEGRERYTVNLRYPRDLRDDLDELGRVLVSTPAGGQVAMSELADVRPTVGPSMIRDEGGMLAGYVYVDVAGRDIGSYLDEARHRVHAAVALPQGYSIVWSGQYENISRVKERLKLVIPITIVLIFTLLYLNTKSAFKALVVMLAIPFSLIGAVWLLWALGYNVSIAVWVGMIALMGLDAETGVFMLLFLDMSYAEARTSGRLNTLSDLKEAIVHGAVKRIRPKAMTILAPSLGLMPIMWSIGTGADVMKRVAAPMVGGLGTSFAMELLVYPAIYLLWRRHTVPPERVLGAGEAVS